jgi:F-type H+-transporting ATPase subunit c
MKELGRYIGSGLCSIGLGGTAVGTGLVLSNVLSSIGKNPSLTNLLFNYGIIFFSLIEALALFSLVLSILILYG